jgi:hypothetical protein
MAPAHGKFYDPLMSLSGIVAIPRLQAKREFVMPAKAGIQVTGQRPSYRWKNGIQVTIPRE